MQHNAEADGTMKSFITLILFVLLFSPAPAWSQVNSILGYYVHADSAADFPRLDKELTILCQRQVGTNFITFIGFQGENIARIVAVTLKPITDLRKEISLTVDFQGITPIPGTITTWGYIYDRNNDGKIDYMVLVGGAAPFKDDNFPSVFPPRGRPLTKEQINYMVGQSKIIFNHFADDNYDGTIDALIQADADSTRDWIERRILVRSSNYDGKFDDVRAFRTALNESVDTIAHRGSSIPYHPIGQAAAAIDQKMFETKTAILSLINHAIELCNFTPDQLAKK